MIAIGCDHGGYELKGRIIKHLEDRGIECKDFGCYSKRSVDYPEFGHAVAKSVASGECALGIVICTTGIGMSIAANKVKGVRAALCSETLSASLTRLHNNANVLALGAGIVGEKLAIQIVDTFIDTDFSKEERHARRVSMIEEV